MAVFWYPQLARTPRGVGRIPRSHYTPPGIQPESPSERLSWVEDEDLFEKRLRDRDGFYVTAGIIIFLPIFLVTAVVPLLEPAWWPVSVLPALGVAITISCVTGIIIHRALRRRRLRAVIDEQDVDHVSIRESMW